MTDILFQSPNLAARRFNTGDGAFIFELMNTPAWKKYIGDRNIHTLDDAVNYIKSGPLTSYHQNGFGGWMVMIKDTGQPIGMCGLFKRDYLDSPDLGFALLPEFEGRGFAYESSTAALQYIRGNYDLKKLYATTTMDNTRSRRLLDRCGFVYNGPITIKGYDDESTLYSLTL